MLALLAATAAGKIEPDTLESALGFLGGPEVVLTLILEPNPRDFDPALLPEESISTDRIDAIRAGAKPTESELKAWREVRLEGVRSLDGDGFHMVSVWQLPVPSGQPHLCGALHEDQGTVVDVVGPFADLDALRAALRHKGILEE